MKLLQYWDTGNPPDEVAAWIDGFRTMNPDMQHRLYDRDRASRFIGKHLGERNRRAFDALAVPSMQSDYFRACALLIKPGAYVDADSVTSRPLRELFAHVPNAMILSWKDRYQLGLMMFRRPGDPLIAAWLAHITRNVEHRLDDNASVVTGPWAIRQVIEAAEPNSPVRASVANITPLLWSDAGPWIGLPRPGYKEGPRHWANWRGPQYLESLAADGAAALLSARASGIVGPEVE